MFLQVPNPKLEFDDFDGPIADNMVQYAVRDVQATWECFDALAARYAGLGLSRTGLHDLYSEASLGKAASKQEPVQLTRQRLASMEEFMEVTNKIFQQFIGNAKSGLTKVVKVLLKAF